MKSGGPWNLRGLRPDAREAARTAARRTGMSVGEWLNNVIRPDDDDDAEPTLFTDFDDEAEDDAPRRSGNDDRERRRDRADHRRRGRDQDFDRESARTRDELGEVHARLDKLSHQLERVARNDVASRRHASRRRSSPSTHDEWNDDHNSRLTGAPPQPRHAVPGSLGKRSPSIERPPARNRSPANADQLSIDEAVAEIAARQRALDGDTAAEFPPDIAAVADLPEPTVDLNNLERQLRHITARIEALRPSSDLEASVTAIRTDLTEIARLITEALPRRAVESLEIEVKALAQRIEHSRQCGVDATAIAGLERGLVEVREALRGLTPAESLVGFDDAVKALAQKVDLIVAKDDPAALQQLETAIGALRGIVSHVASNETLTKVAEDVRSLAAKVDSLASTAASGQSLSALESRIEALANALTASAEAGHAVPRELEKLLSGLIEKLEWVQLTHTDHAALAHLEDRIAMLVQRFDASDAHLGHLEAVERGIADLLVHIEEIRGLNGNGESRRMPPAVGAIERDVAEIKQSELRTQDSLEAVQGTVEHVVDRLAMIESGIRESPAPAAPARQSPVAAYEAKPPQPPSSPAPTPAASAPAAKPTPVAMESAPRRAAAARTPIDPSLPPNHPLEPGSAAGRSRPSASAADRIAASEAAVGSAKPPVIADPGEKPNFIAAARRAAQAAASAPPPYQPDAEAAETSSAKKPRQRVRTLIVAGAAALIVVGCIHIASRLFEDGGLGPAPQAQQEKAAPPAAALPEPEPPTASSPEPTPLPVPSTPPSAAPSSPPSAKSGAITVAKPIRQSALHDSDQQPAPVAAAPAADITGSLPRPAVQNTATGPANAPFGDKLPATIGGPALRAAALSGDASAAYEVAMRFAEGHGVTPSNQEAAVWLERAAKQGLVPAQFRLGSLYEKGVGVKKDLAAARDLYLAAADKGNGKAMHNLAVLYAEGIDGPADYVNAAHWFRLAADHGVKDSQYNLAILYARGIGAAQNFAESYKWFALAANQGDDDAAKKRDEVATHLDQQSLAAARLAVQTWTAEPQPDEAITVKTPAGGWDTTANRTPAAKLTTRPPGVKTPVPDAKIN
ncbi:MAG TPA: hypothetical protein VJX48_06195 [Xanthobacteraceae bacterium]|nr:hypothetical protein [Xanthobacteraceae bacterium]